MGIIIFLMQVFSHIAHLLGKHDTIPASEHAFFRFIAEHNRQYATHGEYRHRLHHFSEYLKFVEEHNSANGNTWTVGVNQFADYTPEERKAMNGYRADLKKANPVQNLSTENLADSVDWRSQVLSPPSRTKLNAVPAGLSPPPVPWRVLTSLPPATSFHSLRSNSSNAPPSTPVAMVVSWTTLSNMLRRPLWSLRNPILTPLELVSPALATRVWKKVEPSPLLPTMMSLLTDPVLL